MAAEAASGEGIGVLVTGAEEFGLVGARVFAREHGPQLVGVEVVNFDILDDQGALYVVSHDESGDRLAERAAARFEAPGLVVRRRSQPLWAFADSQPLARAGAAAITIARLDWATLRKVHTPRDTAAGLTFQMAESAGRLMAGAI